MLFVLLGLALDLPCMVSSSPDAHQTLHDCALHYHNTNAPQQPHETTENIFGTLPLETSPRIVTNRHSGKRALPPEKIERIAQKLLKQTLNTSQVQVSHCILHPDNAFMQDRKIHFHINVISDVFTELPIFVRKNITINLLEQCMSHAETHDLSVDCFSPDERPNGFLEGDLEHLKPYAYGEQVLQDILEEEFNKTFIPEFFYVENVCEHYGLDRGQESHFQILVVSNKFEGKDVAQRRLMVDEIVRRSMMHGIVRLFLKLFTPKEYRIEIEMEKKGLNATTTVTTTKPPSTTVESIYKCGCKHKK